TPPAIRDAMTSLFSRSLVVSCRGRRSAAAPCPPFKQACPPPATRPRLLSYARKAELSCEGMRGDRDEKARRHCGTGCRHTDRAQTDHCGCGILDRRPDRGEPARGARRLRLFPRRRGGLHPRRQARADGYFGRRNEGFSLLFGAICETPRRTD